MATEKPERRVETKAEAKKVLDEAWDRAQQAYEVAKKQADIVYKAIEKHTVDKQAKEEAHKAYKEAVKQAEKVRDAIKNQAKVVFADTWEQAEKEFHDTRYISQIQPIGSKGSHPDV